MSEKHQVSIQQNAQYSLAHPAQQDDAAAKDVEIRRLLAERMAFSKLAKAMSDASSPQQIMDMALSHLVEHLSVRAGLLYLLPSDADGVIASHGTWVIRFREDSPRSWDGGLPESEPYPRALS